MDIFRAFLESLTTIYEIIVVIIDEICIRVSFSLFIISILIYAIKQNIVIPYGWISNINGIISILLIFALAVLFIGMLIKTPNAASSPLISAGISAGTMAAIPAVFIGAIPYYAFNIQDCLHPNSLEKLVRLVSECIVAGFVLGAFIGKFSPAELPSEPTFRNTPGEPRDHTPMYEILLYLLGIILMFSFIGLLIWTSNVILESLPDNSGLPQGNLIYWQIMLIAAVFVLSFVLIVSVKYKWNVYHLSNISEITCTRTIKTLTSITIIGTSLLLLFGEQDLQPEAGFPEPKSCYMAYWSGNSTIEITGKAALLLMFIYCCVWIGVTNKLPSLDRWSVKICKRMRG